MLRLRSGIKVEFSWILEDDTLPTDKGLLGFSTFEVRLPPTLGLDVNCG